MGCGYIEWVDGESVDEKLVGESGMNQDVCIAIGVGAVFAMLRQQV